MTPVIHCSTGTITLFPRTTFTQRREIHPPRCGVSEKYTRQFSSFKTFLLPQPSPQLFQIYKSHRYLNHSSRIQIISAVGTDVTVEEQNSTVTDKDAEEPSETQQKPLEVNETVPETPAAASSKSKRPRSVRKSEMPPVKNEELVTGATFTGKVRSVQPFGAFVDFGAFTDGLVHVSRMSDGYVKDVGSLVSVGQEVKVRIVEANMESGRISLTMRDGDDYTKPQRKEAQSGGNNEKQKTARRNASRSTQKRDAVQKTTNLVKGQVLDGTVKNKTRSGAFISLPDGEEGFLPVSEESEGFGNILGNSSLQVGQEVNVRVLRVSRGQVTLTMKKEEDVDKLNMQLNQGVVHVASNPFELAFRRNKDISAFLDEQERIKQSSKDLDLSRTSEQIEVKSEEIGKETDSLEAESLLTDTNENQISVSSASCLEIKSEKIISREQQEVTAVEDSTSPELVSKNDETVSVSPQDSISVPETLAEESSVSLAGSDSDSVSGDVKDEEHVIISAENANLEENSPASVGSPSDLMSDKAFIDKEASNSAIDIAEEAPVSEGSESSADDSSSHLVKDQVSIASEGTETGIDINSTEETVEVSSVETSPVAEAPLTVQVEEADSEIGTIKGEDSSTAKTTISATDSVTSEASIVVNGSNFTSEPSGEVKDPISSEGAVPEKIVTSQLDGASRDDRVENEVVSYESKDVKLEVPEASNGQTGIPAQVSETKATISPALVKQLREETGAGMMDCKKALAETEGDLVKAREFLRKKGLASADKKASRATAEGRIGSYIHDNRIGVLIEVNCETDFVSRGEIFKELVGDLAMQVAACPQVRYLATEDVPEEIVNKEREIEMEKEDLLSKPEQIRSKIVDGRIRKRLEEFALLEQPYIKNDKMVVKDWVKQTIATVGENIKVKRFVRYNLGEGLEKKNQDFAAEVAAQTAGNPSSAVPKDQSAESKEPTPNPPTTAVSAALVKQLREETGAGMMDCKRALSETGGDLEKAQEYLRKKGLSSAEKKSSRLAAEGRISSYIHDSRIGCLIEVNCETDFVGRNERFKELVDDLAMQVVACPQVEFVSIEDIPETIVNSEKEIEMQREDLQSKPENIREKIVAGRISKRLGELTLLEQPFIKDDSALVKDLVKQTIAALGENIRVRRFVRFSLGENKN